MFQDLWQKKFIRTDLGNFYLVNTASDHQNLANDAVTVNSMHTHGKTTDIYTEGRS